MCLPCAPQPIPIHSPKGPSCAQQLDRTHNARVNPPKRARAPGPSTLATSIRLLWCVVGCVWGGGAGGMRGVVVRSSVGVMSWGLDSVQLVSSAMSLV